MAIYGGPDIVTDGLVLHLDAANSKSYPGSGTSWFDLSGNNNNGTLTNGPTYSSENKGSIVFDGVNDSITSFPTLISGSGSKTISCFFRANSSVRMTLCDTRNNIEGGWVFVINRTASGNLTYFHTAGSILEISAGISTGIWYHVCAVYNQTNSTASLFLNGRILGSPQTSFSGIFGQGYNGGIGRADSNFSNFFNGNISSVQIYNTALSSTAILQNYNALKGRYGL